MRKFLRYEIKRSSNYLVFMTLAAIFLSIIINFIYSKNTANNLSMVLGFYLIIGVVFVVNLIYFTYRFRKDIFSKSAYFTFTINLSTSKIILSKLLGALIISFVNLIVFIFSFKIFALIFRIDDHILVTFNSYVFISILLYWVLSYVFLTMGVSISRVKIFNRYYEFVSLILSVVVLVLIMWLMRNLYKISPTMIDFGEFSIKNLTNINGVDFFMVYYNINHRPIGINLWILIFAIFLIVFGYFINVYLVEEKIDL